MADGTRGLIAIDLDGTLLGVDGTLSERSVDAIRGVVDAGWSVALASGRPPHLVTHLSTRLAGLVTHVVGGNGSIIGTFPTEPGGASELLHLASFGFGTGVRLVEHLRGVDSGLRFALATDAGFAHEPGFAERMPAPVDDDPIDDVLAIGGDSVFKLLVFHADRSVAELTSALPAIVDEALDGSDDGDFAVTHMGADAAEIGPAAIDKCSGLRWLCDHLGIDRADVIAFGDEGNDRTMVEWVGVGYAMENAVAEVKAVADHIAPHHADDGVAQILEQLI